MKTLNASLLSSGNSSASRFEAARQLAYSMAESDQEFIEPELIVWVDRAGSILSSEAVGCFSPNGWYEHFGHGPYVNLRDAQGNESICPGGIACAPPDEWTSELT